MTTIHTAIDFLARRKRSGRGSVQRVHDRSQCSLQHSQKLKGAVYWKPQGDLTLDTICEQQKALKHFLLSAETNVAENAKEHDTKKIIVDLSHVQRSDSAGLAFMIEVVRLVRSRHCTIFFQSIPEQMITMMRFCNVWSFFKEEKWIN